MTLDDVIAALALPSESRVDQRVPKKLLLENGAPTAADKRHINEGVEELFWIAALKPNTIGVPEYRDENCDYLEIAVLALTLRPEAKAVRLVELVHRAIPYPVFLIIVQDDRIAIALARKRLAQNEAGRVVLDEAIITTTLEPHRFTADWLLGLALAAQPRTELRALYHGWIALVEAHQAALITGQLVTPTNTAAQDARRQALADHATLHREIAALRARAQKEKQVSRRVELNLQIKRLETRLEEAMTNL